MYHLIKKSLQGLLPKKVLFRAEPTLRKTFALMYRGSSFQCPVCSTGLRRFVKLSNGDLLCPACGSLGRNRRLWTILEPRLLQKSITVLDFSPSRCLYRKLKAWPGITYISSDFADEFIADRKYDICNIPEPDNAFDLIVCYHILEHIENDSQAMAEIYRALKPGGIALVQTPFKEGDIYENPEISTNEERLAHFGQEDHVRIYSVAGLTARLETAGFHCEVKVFTETPDHVYGFTPKETVIFAKKPSTK